MTANRFSQAIKLNVGFWLGIALFWGMYLMPTPEGMSPTAQKVASVTLLMICWWVSEAIPIAVTALVPLAAFPVFGVLNSKEAAAPYADDNVFLFLGGFCIAIAMEKWHLHKHKRIALHIIRFIGGNPRQVVLGFMAATAFISMWISNTATTMMMLPIGLAVIQHYRRGGAQHSNFGAALMLGIAYSASIGGIGTLIGTPPNIVLAGQMKIFFPQIPEIGFFQWMQVGVHPLLLMMPAAISASCAFMTPVGTPPNAIVFASGEVTIPMMAKTGLVLNFIGVVLVTLLVYFVAVAAFGIVL